MQDFFNALFSCSFEPDSQKKLGFSFKIIAYAGSLVEDVGAIVIFYIIALIWPN